ncbi:MAG: hypothetical protein V5A25_12105 [Halovenus sp.]
MPDPEEAVETDQQDEHAEEGKRYLFDAQLCPGVFGCHLAHPSLYPH